ncbi:hypothetical protein RKD29_006051 [Streptomyces tendae]|uniref:hypothetical protein n=1 Tax=Streptomyces tendae TaxID=1932 RepID=UPI003837CDD8
MADHVIDANRPTVGCPAEVARRAKLLSRHFIASRGPRIGQSLDRSAYVLLTRMETGDPRTLKELAHTFRAGAARLSEAASWDEERTRQFPTLMVEFNHGTEELEGRARNHARPTGHLLFTRPPPLTRAGNFLVPRGR